MKININPKNLFRSNKSSTVSRSESDPSSFSSGTSSDSASDHKIKGSLTPTSVFPHQAKSSYDELSKFSSDAHLELVQAFKVIDLDGDGKITRAELAALLSKVGGDQPPTPDELSAMLSEVDRDGDGCISLEEFGAISSALFGHPACDDELREAFDFFDADHDGRITAEELFKVFTTSMGDGKCTLEDCRRMISNVDKNGDGFVCFEDFTRMMELQRR